MLQEISNILPKFAFSELRLYRWAKNNKGQYIYCNDEMVKDLGLQKKEDIIDLTDFDLCWATVANTFTQNDKEVMRTKNSKIYIEECPTINNKKFECYSFKMILPGRIKKALGTIGTAFVLPSNLYKQNSSINNDHLTQRQLQCLVHLSKGMTAKEIAQCLMLSQRTVEYYLGILKDKFNCQSKSELIKKALSLESVKTQLFLKN